jgi:CxxC motif-containing protein (DUF1111 family)
MRLLRTRTIITINARMCNLDIRAIYNPNGCQCRAKDGRQTEPTLTQGTMGHRLRLHKKAKDPAHRAWSLLRLPEYLDSM